MSGCLVKREQYVHLSARLKTLFRTDGVEKDEE